jgi:hypothetical protein
MRHLDNKLVKFHSLVFLVGHFSIKSIKLASEFWNACLASYSLTCRPHNRFCHAGCSIGSLSVSQSVSQSSRQIDLIEYAFAEGDLASSSYSLHPKPQISPNAL